MDLNQQIARAILEQLTDLNKMLLLLADKLCERLDPLPICLQDLCTEIAVLADEVKELRTDTEEEEDAHAD